MVSWSKVFFSVDQKIWSFKDFQSTDQIAITLWSVDGKPFLCRSKNFDTLVNWLKVIFTLKNFWSTEKDQFQVIELTWATRTKVVIFTLKNFLINLQRTLQLNGSNLKNTFNLMIWSSDIWSSDYSPAKALLLYVIWVIFKSHLFVSIIVCHMDLVGKAKYFKLLQLKPHLKMLNIFGKFENWYCFIWFK